VGAGDVRQRGLKLDEAIRVEDGAVVGERDPVLRSSNAERKEHGQIARVDGIAEVLVLSNPI